MIHADTHNLPQEALPRQLPPGTTGASFGWPDQMCGDETFAMLFDRGITKTSQCIQLALCMQEKQFQAFMGGGRPSWAYLRRVMTHQANIEQYETRKSAWEADHVIINNRILQEWLLPQVGPADVLPVFSQQVVIHKEVAENNARR